MVGPGEEVRAGKSGGLYAAYYNLDPIRYSLIFERFLNPERVSMPDIDIDFCIERRGEVIGLCKKKVREGKCLPDH